MNGKIFKQFEKGKHVSKWIYRKFVFVQPYQIGQISVIINVQLFDEQENKKNQNKKRKEDDVESMISNVRTTIIVFCLPENFFWN